MVAMIEHLPRNKRNIALVAVALLVLWFGWSIRSVLNPLILGYILAAIVVPVVRVLTKRGWNHRNAVVVVFASAMGVSLLVGLGIAVQLRFLVRDLMPARDASSTVEQSEDPGVAETPDAAPASSNSGVVELVPNRPPEDSDGSEGNEEETSAESSESLVAVLDDERPINRVIEKADAWVVETFGVPHLTDEVRRAVIDLLPEDETELTQAGGRVALGIWSRLRSLTETIFGLSTLVLLVPLYAFFWMFEMDAMHDWIRRHIPKRERGRTARMAEKMGDILSRFFRGRLTICVIKGLLITVALAVAGVQYSILLGLLAGILSLVPFVGSVVAFGLGTLVALGSHDPWWFALIVTIAIYGAAELIEGYILMPRILGDSLGLSEVAVLFAVTAGAASLGLFGVLAALPLAAAIKVAFTEYVDPALTQWADEPRNAAGDEIGEPPGDGSSAGDAASGEPT
jgi:predicted PurR-regulated permease PerM